MTLLTPPSLPTEHWAPNTFERKRRELELDLELELELELKLKLELELELDLDLNLELELKLELELELELELRLSKKDVWFIDVPLKPPYATFCNWLKNLAPIYQPIRSKTKRNRDLLARLFPRLAPVTCICFEFWLVHRIACEFCDWLE